MQFVVNSLGVQGARDTADPRTDQGAEEGNKLVVGDPILQFGYWAYREGDSFLNDPEYWKAKAFAAKQALQKAIPIPPVKVATQLLFSGNQAGAPDPDRFTEAQLYAWKHGLPPPVEGSGLVFLMLAMWNSDP